MGGRGEHQQHVGRLPPPHGAATAASSARPAGGASTDRGTSHHRYRQHAVPAADSSGAAAASAAAAPTASRLTGRAHAGTCSRAWPTDGAAEPTRRSRRTLARGAAAAATARTRPPGHAGRSWGQARAVPSAAAVLSALDGQISHLSNDIWCSDVVMTTRTSA